MNFETLNRTLWTNKKAYLSNMENDGTCDQEEDTEHNMFIGCDRYPLPIWQKLDRILQTAYTAQIAGNQDISGDMPKITRYQMIYLQEFNSLEKKRKHMNAFPGHKIKE